MRQRRFVAWLVIGITAGVGTAPAFAKGLSLTPLDSEPAAPRRAKGEVGELESQVQAEPRDRAARLALVRALIAAGRLPEALDAARDWRAHDAYNLVAVRSVGDVYAEMGDRERARRAYSAVVELLPNDARAQRALVGVLKQSGDLEAAYDRLAAAAALAPTDPRIAFERADTAQRLGRGEEAARLFREVIDAPGVSPSLRYPAAQRLAQLLGSHRREVIAAGDSETAVELVKQIESLGIAGGVENDIKVFLSWDTDRTDVDLWVTNPRGEKVYYERRQGSLGDALYDDVTTGYGPESYSAPEAAKGTYLVQVNFYQTDRQAFAEARGEVTVILHEGTAQETRRVLPYRLFEQGQTVSVAKIEVEVMRVIAVVLLALALAPSAPVVTDGPAAGVGRLDADAADGSSHPLELRRLAVDATVRGDAAETRVEHVFWNPTEETLQGTFRFPLPDEAVLVGLAMEVEGRLVEGELVEREKAQRVYEQIVDGMRDPALLEWEGGSVFKLRVFPIEPLSEKRVVIRYVSPLRRDARKGWQYVHPIGAETDLGAFRLMLDGEVRWDATTFPAQAEIALDVPRERWPSDVQREETADAAYTAVRVRPDWTLVPLPPEVPRTRRHVLVLLDDSRSALESRPLALQALQVLLDGLDGRDRFRVAAFDITMRDQTDAFVPFTREAAAQAMEFARALEPDGASDLSLALRHAGRLAAALSPEDRAGLEVVYLGDGAPTWGETGRDALVALVQQELPGARFHSAALGRGANAGLLQALSGATGGRFEQPRRLQDVIRLSGSLSQARHRRQIRDARVLVPEGHTVLPDGPRTLFEDDDWQVIVRSPQGAPLPSLVLEGRTVLGPFRQALDLRAASPGGFLAPRFGTLAVAALEGSGGSRDDVVRASLQYGVMSRHTAFLVLESEEAYARFQIRRREAQEAARVTGGDLESTDGASLSPDRIQPGDPEVRIPAPADARAVTVTFPFGETKVARYEPELGAWTVRFLIDQDTPDGVYPVYVRITHADGRVELLRLAYTVDTEAPSVALTWRWAAGRSRTYLIEARQIATEAPLSPVEGSGASRVATIVEDARRVDVRLPDGEVLSLGLTRPGLFRGYWRPRRPLTAPVTLTVVAMDRALNSRTAQVTLDPQPASSSSR